MRGPAAASPLIDRARLASLLVEASAVVAEAIVPRAGAALPSWNISPRGACTVVVVYPQLRELLNFVD